MYLDNVIENNIVFDDALSAGYGQRVTNEDYYNYDGEFHANDNFDDVNIYKDDIDDSIKTLTNPEEIKRKFLKNMKRQGVTNDVGPYYHTSTSNKSFLHMAKMLKDLGNVNNKFMLLLLDKDLAHVNPRDPGLSDEMKQKIIVEARNNFWYYVRELVRIQTPGDPEGVPFRAHVGNMAIFFLMLQDFNFYVEQARQTGKTLGVVVFDSWIYGLNGQNINMLYLHYDKEESTKNKNTLLSTIKALPTYLQLNKYKKVETKDGEIWQKQKSRSEKVHLVKNDALGNTLKVLTPGTTPSKARKAGRGNTAPILTIDELGYITYNWIVMGSIAHAYKTAAEIAKAAGQHYGIRLMSTPSIIGTKYGDWLYNFIFNECGQFDVRMFDFSYEELKNYLLGFKKDFFVVRFGYRELGYTDEWALSRKKLSATISDFKTEVLLMWLRGGTDNPFTPYELDKLTNVNKDITTENFLFEKKYPINLAIQDVSKMRGSPNIHDYIKHYFMSPVVIGVDVSQGIGRDNSTMVAVDALTGFTIATYKSNTLGPTEFGLLFERIVKHLFEHNLKVIVIERNGIGAGLINHLDVASDLSSSLFYEKISDNTLRKNGGFSQRSNNTDKYLLGVHMTDDKRNNIGYKLLVQVVKKRPELISSADMVMEIGGLITKNKNGKIVLDHGPNTHDDITLGWIHAMMALVHPQSVLPHFGIPLLDLALHEDEDNQHIERIDKSKSSIVNTDKQNNISMIDFINGIRTGVVSGDKSLNTLDDVKKSEKKYSKFDTLMDELYSDTKDDDPYNDGSNFY